MPQNWLIKMSVCMNSPSCLSYEHITAIKSDCGIHSPPLFITKRLECFIETNFLHFPRKIIPWQRTLERSINPFQTSLNIYLFSHSLQALLSTKEQNFCNFSEKTFSPNKTSAQIRTDESCRRVDWGSSSLQLQGLHTHVARNSSEPDRGNYSP